MASERTPLVNATNASPPRHTRRLLVAKIIVGVVLVSALGAVFHASTRRVPPPAVATTAATTGDWFCGEAQFEADYVKLANKHDDYYFYWFAPSRSATPDTDPLVVWLNGGPGASSLEGLLTENGPCFLQQDLSLKRNDYAWNNNANVIWLEQPTGVGFSYFTDDADKDATGEDVGKNMFAFVDGFIDKHPEFAGRPFYLTGESYAGHYIPAAAYYIWQKNKEIAGEVKRINLQGVAIGNGDPNLVLQYKYSVNMATDNAYNLTLLNDTQIAQMKIDAEECTQRLATCVPYGKGPTGCLEAAGACDGKILSAYAAGGRNVYDFRQKCDNLEDCYDTDGGVVERFLESESVRNKLKPTIQGREWNAQVGYISEAYIGSGDWARVYMPEIATLLNEGLRMLIYAGDADLVCNWIGNRAWTLALDWNGKKGYAAATESDFVVDAPAGTIRQFENLTFIRISNAGHLVPKDQPKVSWEMINRFLNSQPF